MLYYHYTEKKRVAFRERRGIMKFLVWTFVICLLCEAQLSLGMNPLGLKVSIPTLQIDRVERLSDGSDFEMESPLRSLSSSPRSMSSSLSVSPRGKLPRIPSYFSIGSPSLSPDEEYDSQEASPFKSDQKKEESTCGSQLKCCWQAFKEFGVLVCNGGCGLLPKLLTKKPEGWAYELVRSSQENLQPLGDSDIFKGDGGYVFWDCRNSSVFCQQGSEGWEKFAKFMAKLTDHLFLPIGQKYNLKIVGMNGDGPLYVRIKEKGEDDAAIANDVVGAAMELVARYPEIKEKYQLDGPAYCGAGCDIGEFYVHLTPLEKNNPFVVPAIVSKYVTNAFFCEQENKRLRSGLVITSQVLDLLRDNRMKRVFTSHEITTKAGELEIHSATLKKIKNLYNQTTHQKKGAQSTKGTCRNCNDLVVEDI